MTWRQISELLDLAGFADIARQACLFVVYATALAAGVWVGFRAFSGVLG